MSYEPINNGKRVKCRKEHPCGWCSEKILKGEYAMYRVYKWEGDFQYEHMHVECYDAMSNSPEASEGFYPGEQKRGATIQESER